jgi:hypothetical protein
MRRRAVFEHRAQLGRGGVALIGIAHQVVITHVVILTHRTVILSYALSP